MGFGTSQPRAARPRRRRGAGLAVLLAAAFALWAAPAARAARPSLPNAWGSSHFLVHYDPAISPLSTAQAVAADAEEGYTHLVTGGGATPNAGLRAPIDDGDQRTDIYLTIWSGDPSYRGGLTLADGTAPYASWFILTPELSLGAMRFRAVHEFMHVLQQAYQPNPAAPIAGMWTESTANWSVEWSLPDVDPGDSNLYDDPAAPAPWLPLDCAYGTWPTSGGRPCGNGYWQWLFMQRQVEDYGVDFISGLLERVKACVSACTSTSTHTAMLNAEIVVQSGGGATLATRFGRYAWQVWDPTMWTTTAVASMHSNHGRPPALARDRSSLGSGYSGEAYVVDHLGTRYLLVRNLGDSEPGGPGDVLGYQLTRPAGEPATWVYLTRAKGSTSWVPHSTSSTTGSIPFDPALTREAMLPLTNTTLTDGASFGYGLKLTRGTATPPPNDMQEGALTATLDAEQETDTVYAGGRGDLEAGPCGTTDMSTVRNGVWFRFTAPNAGMYTFSALSSTEKPVIVLRTHGTTSFEGCAALSGSFTTALSGGADRDIYIGRRPSDTGDGTLARLLVSGPPSNTAPPTISGTARDGAVLAETGIGTWTGAPTITTRQWRRCHADGTACTAIPRATGTSYTLTPADVGSAIVLRVTQSNANGSGTGQSAPSAVVAAAPSALPTRTVALRTAAATPDRRGRVTLRLRCSSSDAAPCDVTVTLRTASKVKVGGSRRIVTLGTGRGSLPAGATTAVRVTVSAAGRRLVRRQRRIRATVRVSVRQPDGTFRVVAGMVSLRAR